MKSRDSEDIASNKHIAGVPFFAPFDGSSVACTNRVCNKKTAFRFWRNEGTTVL
nr:MAG TPA: hypothetical protein [Caudoviricetes sp.]